MSDHAEGDLRGRGKNTRRQRLNFVIRIQKFGFASPYDILIYKGL